MVGPELVAQVVPKGVNVHVGVPVGTTAPVAPVTVPVNVITWPEVPIDWKPVTASVGVALPTTTLMVEEFTNA